MNGIDFKDTFRQCPGLVKDHGLCPGKCFQIIGTLYENPCITCPSDSCEEAKWNTDHKGTRTADDEEGKRPVDPGSPVRRKPHKKHPDKRRQERKCQCRIADRRRIDPGKSGDKIFRTGFPGTCILHQIQNLRYRRLSKFFCGPDFQNACHVNTSTDNLIPCFRIFWKTFSCQRTGI